MGKKKKKFQVALVKTIEVNVTYYDVEALTEEKAKEIASTRFNETYETGFGKDVSLEPDEHTSDIREDYDSEIQEMEDE